MKFTYAPYNLCMHLDPFSGPKNDAFSTSKSVKIDPKTRSETKMFFESLLVRFLVSFGTPRGAVWVPKWDAKPCTSRLGLPGTHPGVDLASSKRHYGISKALGVALGPFLAPILGPWPPFWTLRGSILDPPGLHFGPSGRPLGVAGDGQRTVFFLSGIALEPKMAPRPRPRASGTLPNLKFL